MEKLVKTKLTKIVITQEIKIMKNSSTHTSTHSV